MTKLQAIRWFCNYVCEDKIIVSRDKFANHNCAIDVTEKHPRIKLFKNLDYKVEPTDIQFRNDFIKRYPPARGFSHITLELLHECGHWATRSVINLFEYSKMVGKTYGSMDAYMAIPYEHLATDWAICWLCSPHNRKIAKQFEKDFFGY